jgi:hypothetical protein
VMMMMMMGKDSYTKLLGAGGAALRVPTREDVAGLRLPRLTHQGESLLVVHATSRCAPPTGSCSEVQSPLLSYRVPLSTPGSCPPAARVV